LEDTVARRATRLVEGYAPAYVVVDDHQDVLHFSGRTGKYIQPSPGAASLNLFNLLDASLRPAVRTVLHKAMTSGRKVVEKNVLVAVNGDRQAVNVVVEPLAPTDGSGRFFVVLFQDAGPLQPHDAEATPGAVGEQDERVTHLEADLAAMHERLQTTVEELEASNEEMRASNEEFQSVNEELQSSNEELETAKEELQSVNEELETVNAELNSKIESLESAINDRKNLLESTQIATIFLDGALRIKTFTPAIVDIFPLVDSDYGRPITDIVTRLADRDFERDVRKVLRTLERVEEEVILSDGSAAYMMRVLPYRTVGNAIEGVVITFIDITERRRNEEDLARLASIVATSHDAIIGLAPDGTVITWNAGAERIYGYAAADVVGKSWSLVLDPERPSELQAILERVKRLRVGVTVETRRLAKDGRHLDVASTVSPIHDAAGKVVALSAIERDISGHEQAKDD
jgi:two-component system CheB/CheR fusion protein